MKGRILPARACSHSQKEIAKRNKIMEIMVDKESKKTKKPQNLKLIDPDDIPHFIWFKEVEEYEENLNKKTIEEPESAWDSKLTDIIQIEVDYDPNNKGVFQQDIPELSDQELAFLFPYQNYDYIEKRDESLQTINFTQKFG